jgi:putative SOS response-associated peptidase YedK
VFDHYAVLGALVPFWARDARDGVKRINARAETIVTTASFREAIKTRR